MDSLAIARNQVGNSTPTKNRSTSLGFANGRALELGTEMVTGLYADCNSLWHGAYSLARGSGMKDNPRVDYRRLSSKLLGTEKERMLTAYVLGGPGVDMAGFKTALEKHGYEVVAWDKAAIRTARTKILADLLQDLDEGVTHFIVATQDTFFAPILAELKAMGKRVTVACFGSLPPEYEKLGISHQSLGDDVFQAARPASL